MGVWLLLAAALFAQASLAQSTADWKPIFDGKSLDGWSASRSPGRWSVKDGTIRGEGTAGQLVYVASQCVDCELKADVRINHGGNAGISVRAPAGANVETGYETPVNSTSTVNPVRTGGLYAGIKILKSMQEQLIPDDTWFHVQIAATGNHIQVFVNGKLTADVVDPANTYLAGNIAFQKYDRGALVEFKNVMMRPLPDRKSPLQGR
jgi:hypothetical protein